MFCFILLQPFTHVQEIKMQHYMGVAYANLHLSRGV